MTDTIHTVPSPSPAPSETSGRAIASLVFAILGIVGVAPCLGPVLGLVLGHGETSGVGRAGVVLSWVALGLYALVAMFAVVAIGIAVVAEIVS